MLRLEPQKSLIQTDKLLVQMPWQDLKLTNYLFCLYSLYLTMFLHRDAIITCIVNTLTCLLAGVLVFSILGYMAFITGSTIHDVVNSGPGLVFLTYPDLVLSLPGSVVWATIFFVMLLVLGIDSEFCNVEALVTGIVDNWPDQLLKHRRKFTIALCLGLFCLGLPLCTHVSISEKL